MTDETNTPTNLPATTPTEGGPPAPASRDIFERANRDRQEKRARVERYYANRPEPGEANHVPPAGPQLTAHGREIAELKKQMADPREWAKNTEGQARYRELLEMGKAEYTDAPAPAEPAPAAPAADETATRSEPTYEARGYSAEQSETLRAGDQVLAQELGAEDYREVKIWFDTLPDQARDIATRAAANGIDLSARPPSPVSAEQVEQFRALPYAELINFNGRDPGEVIGRVIAAEDALYDKLGSENAAMFKSRILSGSPQERASWFRWLDRQSAR